MKIKILSVGDSNCTYFNSYLKRICLPIKAVTLSPKKYKFSKQYEIEIKKETDKMQNLIILDEKGKNLSSQEFAIFLESLLNHQGPSAFILGGAEGIPSTIKEKATHKIAMGRMTWPHELARILIIEQIYRAQQILKGHPYHKI